MTLESISQLFLLWKFEIIRKENLEPTWFYSFLNASDKYFVYGYHSFSEKTYKQEAIYLVSAYEAEDAECEYQAQTFWIESDKASTNEVLKVLNLFFTRFL